MLRVAVCDDEPRMVEKIKGYIQNYEMMCKVDTYHSGECLLKEKKEYDLIFLDIDMRGMNGIHAAQRIRSYDKKVKIIYITGYEEYRNYAFSVHACGYLVKPVNQEVIHRQLKEVLEYAVEDIPPRMLRFETETGITELEVRDIYYFEYVERKIKMVTKGKDFLIKGSITQMAVKMEPYDFCMPHKSFSVNLLYVKNIKGYDIFMMNGAVIPLSQKKSVEFREKLSSFLANQI